MCVAAAAVACETVVAEFIVWVVAPPPMLTQMMIISVNDVLEDDATSTLMSFSPADVDFLMSSAPLAINSASKALASAKGAAKSAAIVENLMMYIRICD